MNELFGCTTRAEAEEVLTVMELDPADYKNVSDLELIAHANVLLTELEGL